MKRVAKRVLARLRAPWFSSASTDYWTKINVTAHQSFASAEASLDYFHWRNAQYLDYIQLLPVRGWDGKVVLDYGCGPGNDLVGFGHFSKPSRLIGMDVSPTSLQEAMRRLELHGIRAEMMQIRETDPTLPLEDNSIDLVHSSGVVHHTPNPLQILREMKRVLKPGGEAQIMIYNYDSLWVHLYVAYVKQIDEGFYRNAPIRDAFRRTTDGEFCPIANVYSPAEFLAMAKEAGFEGEHIGNSISMHEINLLPRMREAAGCAALAEEHRTFLSKIAYNDRGIPTYGGAVAGIDGCFRLRDRCN